MTLSEDSSFVAMGCPVLIYAVNCHRSMLSAVWKTIRREQLLGRGDHVVVAVSGGPDSMALLAALWELAPRLQLRLAVATVDHGLRLASRDEAALVAERA